MRGGGPGLKRKGRHRGRGTGADGALALLEGKSSARDQLRGGTLRVRSAFLHAQGNAQVGVKAGAGLNWEGRAWWGLFQGNQGRAEDRDLPGPLAGGEGPETARRAEDKPGQGLWSGPSDSHLVKQPCSVHCPQPPGNQHPKPRASENESNNHSRTTGVNEACPGHTGICGHSSHGLGG